jgi:hypothetical protein
MDFTYDAFYRLVSANQDKKFLLTYENGDVIQAVFDMEFEDDTNSSAGAFEETVSYKTLSFTVDKVIKDVTKHYKQGHVILVSPLDMPVSYRILG